MVLLIILTVTFGIVVVGVSIIYYVEEKEIKRIKRYNQLRNMGLNESAYITYKSSLSWTNFCG